MRRKILIVEDDIDSYTVLKQLFEMEYEERDVDITVDVAHNGEVGVFLALSNHYDVIIMDIGLPGIDGIEAAKQIRVKKPTQNIISHSGHALSSEISSHLFNLNHRKPMKFPLFVEQIESLCYNSNNVDDMDIEHVEGNTADITTS
jgi:two-component system copper resistance phosphate regulon response regulator CusR